MNATSTLLPARKKDRIRAILAARGAVPGLAHFLEHGALVALTLLALNCACMERWSHSLFLL
jgi:hypothetical protein